MTNNDSIQDAVAYDDDGHVLVRRAEALAEVVLNRPERLNALTWPMGQAITRAFTDLSADESVKVIIFRALGRAFSTGADMTHVGLQYGDRAQAEEAAAKPRRPSQRRRLQTDWDASRSWEAVFHCSKVVVFQARGYVLGPAVSWLLASDITVCAENVILGNPPARMIAASGVNTLFDLFRMGPTLHAELTLMGRYVGVERFERFGVINRVVADDQLEAVGAAAADAVSNMPADGLYISKFNRRLSLEMLGLRASQMQSAMGHAMQVQQRLEPGEWNLGKERDEHGVKGSYQRRDARFRDALQRYDPEGIAL